VYASRTRLIKDFECFATGISRIRTYLTNNISIQISTSRLSTLFAHGKYSIPLWMQSTLSCKSSGNKIGEGFGPRLGRRHNIDETRTKIRRFGHKGLSTMKKKQTLVHAIVIIALAVRSCSSVFTTEWIADASIMDWNVIEWTTLESTASAKFNQFCCSTLCYDCIHIK